MPKLAQQAVQSLVLCDEIRQENTGKLLLIGVYTGNIVLPPNANSPIVMRLSAFLHFSSDTRAGQPIKVSIYQPEQKSPLFEAEFEAPDAKAPFLAMQFGNFIFPTFGDYRIKVFKNSRAVYETSVSVEKVTPPTQREVILHDQLSAKAG